MNANFCSVYGAIRSPTIICAYLIKYHGLTAVNAIKHVKSKRAVVSNTEFHASLKNYEKYLKIPVSSLPKVLTEKMMPVKK
jgi:protein-tyrosine phosphatase